jgi:hypothetical protein
MMHGQQNIKSSPNANIDNAKGSLVSTSPAPLLSQKSLGKVATLNLSYIHSLCDGRKYIRVQ